MSDSAEAIAAGQAQALAQARYTRYDLESCEEVAAKILERGGQVSNAMLAAILGYKSANNGAYMQRLAGARLFGLVEGQGQDIRASDRARDIIEPRSPADAVRARLHAFGAVPLYGHFLSRHEGRPLPSPESMVREIIHTYGLSQDAAKIAQARLMSSARQAGLFSVQENMMIPPPTPAPTAAPEPAPEPDTRVPSPRRSTNGDYPLFIVAALDEVPWNKADEWSEDELREWMEWLERGMRVHLRMSRSRQQASKDSG